MKRVFILCLLFVGWLIARCEQVITLRPTDDTYVYSDATIRGMEDYLKVYHSTTGTQYRRIIFLKFDISTVPTVVDSVVLRMYTDGWSAGGDKSHRFDVYPVALSSWAEDDMTFADYKTKAGADNNNLLVSSTEYTAGSAQAAGWVRWTNESLRMYVQDSAAAAQNYISFRIREQYPVKNGSNAVIVQFHSKENPSDQAPELVIYAPDGAQPAEHDTIPVVHDSAEARLSAIYLDGEPLEFFDKDKTSYQVNLPYTTQNNPVLTATCLDTIARYIVNDNSITCTSADGQHQQTYTLSYTILPKMDLFLAIGQSNMSGRAPFDDARDPMENIYLLTPKGGMEISSNPMNKYSNIRKDLSVQGMGPHYQFALTMRDSLPENTVGMVVNALGGSSITQWYKPGTTLYDATIMRVETARKWGEFKGIIWHQGESDKGHAADDNFVTYKNRLQTMVTNLRKDLGNDSIWFIVGELSPKEDQAAFNQNVIQAVSSYIDYSDYASSEGCTLLSDNTHFDETSVKKLGQRYAERMLEHVYQSSDPKPTKKSKPVALYLQNLPIERLGSWTDQQIIDSLRNMGFIVATKDCSGMPATSPELETSLVEWYKTVPTYLKAFETDSEKCDLNNIYMIPAGYMYAKIAVWNIVDHAADGTLEYIINTWNEEIVPAYHKDSAHVYTDMVDQQGHQLDYNLYLDLIYPSGTSTKQVPLLINHASNSPRQGGSFYPSGGGANCSIFPFGFMTTGYAFGNLDHCYNPLARGDVYKYFNKFTLDDYNGLAFNTAAIRYIRGHLNQYNLNGKIGCMGISKASYSPMRLSDPLNATRKEHSRFGGKDNTHEQPWPGYASNVDVIYSAAGNGTNRITQYFNSGCVPILTSAGKSDEYQHWRKFPPVVNYLRQIDHNHMDFWMEDLGHTYPSTGVDTRTGEKRYVLFKTFFDRYLKPNEVDTMAIYYILPKEGAIDVTTRGESRTLPRDGILPTEMSGVSPYEPITVRYLHVVDTTHLASWLRIVDEQDQPIKGEWTLTKQGNALTYRPADPFISGNTYRILVGTGEQQVERAFTVTQQAEDDKSVRCSIFPIAEDSYIKASGDATVHGAETELKMRYSQYGQYRYDTYIKVVLPVDSIILDSLCSISISLALTSGEPKEPLTINFFTCDNNWSETTLVTANRPATGSNPIIQMPYDASKARHEYDITGKCKQALQAGESTLSFCMRVATSSCTDYVNYGSKENQNTSLQPQLIVKHYRPQVGPTMLQETQPSENTTNKFIENGQLYIQKNGKRYTVLGVQH